MVSPWKITTWKNVSRSRIVSGRTEAASSMAGTGGPFKRPKPNRYVERSRTKHLGGFDGTAGSDPFQLAVNTFEDTQPKKQE